MLWALPKSLLAGLAAEAAACFYIDCWVFLDRRLYAIGSDGDRICGHHAVVAHAVDEDSRARCQLGSLAQLVGHDGRGRRHEDDLFAALVITVICFAPPDALALDTVPLVIALSTVPLAGAAALTVPLVIALGVVLPAESVVSGRRSQA